jgi:hypothetical protein
METETSEIGNRTASQSNETLVIRFLTSQYIFVVTIKTCTK